MSNAKWGTGEYGTPGGTVTWSFANTPGTGFGFSSYITDPIYQDIIRDAFQAWEDVIDIDFVEATPGADTDIKLGWDVIDGPFSVVGEASTRGSKTTSTLFSFTEAEIRFDIAENWATDRDAARDEVGLYQVALHEIGHVLGLDHAQNAETIMFASDISDLPGLTAGDIEGAQIFYGAAQTSSTPDPVEPDPDPVEPAPVVTVPDPVEPTPVEPTPTPTAPAPAPVVGHVATRGNDTFSARAGDEVIDGMGGFDTLTVTGEQSEYTLTLSAGSIVLTDRQGRDGSDMLISIEQIDFQTGANNRGGGVFEIDDFDGVATLSEDDFTQIVELYIAYFNRAPDAVGLAFWGNAFADGLSLSDMAALFIDQDETRATYADSLSNSEFATAVYNNVLGRVPDADGFDFWVDVLDQGTVGRDIFILSVLEGAKAAPPSGANGTFISQMLEDRQYLSDKIDVGAYFAVHKGMSDVADAAAAMAIFDGSFGSIQDAIAAIDDHYADALSAGSGDFLLPLVGVLDDPFSV
ncbi:MAG: matrixin family metalloprotease [Sulfitobacter sp.]